MSDEQPPKVVGISKARAKRLMNASKAAIHQMGGSRERLEQREAETCQKLANACAILEAMVRRHGPQVFDRGTVQSLCAAGRIKWVVTADRIRIELDDRFNDESDSTPIAPTE